MIRGRLGIVESVTEWRVQQAVKKRAGGRGGGNLAPSPHI